MMRIIPTNLVTLHGLKKLNSRLTSFHCTKVIFTYSHHLSQQTFSSPHRALTNTDNDSARKARKGPVTSIASTDGDEEKNARRNHQDVPVVVRRRAWEICLPLFCETADVHCRSFLSQPAAAVSDIRRPDNPIKLLSECIGNSEKLFTAFADHCSLKMKEECSPLYGKIMMNVLTSIQEAEEKISSIGKLHDMCWMLGHCLRQGKVDMKHVLAIIDTLKLFITSQHTKLEKAHEIEYQRAVHARVAFNNAKNIKVNKEKNLSYNSLPNLAEQNMKSKISNATTPIAINTTNNNSNPTLTLALNSASTQNVKRPREIEIKNPPVPVAPKISTADEILKSLLSVFRDALKYLTELDKDGIFAHKVTDKIAPGYSAQIKQPMYLSKISEKIRARIYTDMSDMCADVELMFHNCIQFNSSTSSYGKIAVTFLKRWEGVKGKYSARYALISGSSTKNAVIAPTVNNGSKTNNSYNKMELHSNHTNKSDHTKSVPPPPSSVNSLTSSFSSSSSSSSSIQISTSAQSNPEKIREPKIPKKLVIQESDSEDDQFGKAIKKQKTSYITTQPSTQDIQKSEIASNSDRKALTLPPITVELDKSMKEKEALKAVLDAAWQYISDADSESVFAIAVTDAMAPGYSQEIQEPIDLSLIRLKMDRKKYKNLDSFNNDVQQMFSNCIKYDRNASHYSVLSKELSRAWGATKKLLEEALNSRESIGVKNVPEDLVKIAEKISNERSIAAAAELKLKLMASEIEESSLVNESNFKKELSSEMDIKEEKRQSDVKVEMTENNPALADQWKKTSELNVPTVRTGENMTTLSSTDDLSETNSDKMDIEKTDPNPKGSFSADLEPIPESISLPKGIDMPSDSKSDVQSGPVSAASSSSDPDTDNADSSSGTTRDSGSATTDSAAINSSSSGSSTVNANVQSSRGNSVSESVSASVSGSESGRDSNSGSGGDGQSMDVVPHDLNNPQPVHTSEPQAVKSITIAATPTPSTTSALPLISVPAPKVPTLTPVEPSAPPDLPTPSAILIASRKADVFFKKQAISHDGGMGGKGLGDELPGVLAEGKLLWMLCILRDPSIQCLLLKFLTGRLSDMLKSRNTPPVVRGMTNGVQVGLLGAVMSKKISFPNDDVICKYTLQLCQLSLTHGHELRGLDLTLLRCEVPMVMFDVLCASSDLSGPDTAAHSSSLKDAGSDTLFNFISKCSSIKTHGEIARHAIETCQSFSEGSSGSADDAQLRVTLLETIAKQLLEVNQSQSK